MKYYIITGASRGLGFEICKQLLNPSHHLFCIARSPNEELVQMAFESKTKLNYIIHDLSNTEEITDLISNIIGNINREKMESIHLINNAAVLPPLKTIHQCKPEEIIRNINTNLLAPILLTQALIDQTQTWNVKTTILNISSGSAKYPASGMSVYCTSKAGVNMFTQCIGEEEHNKNLFTIFAIDPGMIDTEMQEMARSSNLNDLPSAKYFQESKENGLLNTSEFVAQKIVEALSKVNKSGSIINL